jgi:Protein of unknown function (DUF723).
MKILPTTIFAAVICPNHGQVDIDYANYMAQMAACDSRWKCPKCGFESEFDDDRYEHLADQRQLEASLTEVGHEPDSPFDEVAGQDDPFEPVP